MCIYVRQYEADERLKQSKRREKALQRMLQEQAYTNSLPKVKSFVSLLKENLALQRQLQEPVPKPQKVGEEKLVKGKKKIAVKKIKDPS